MAENSGRLSLIGAVIVAVAVVAGSAIIANGLSRVTAQVDRTGTEIKAALADAQKAMAAAGRPAPQPTRRRGPDPDKRYTIPIKGAPIRGPETAKVTIVEFSDFQ